MAKSSSVAVSTWCYYKVKLYWVKITAVEACTPADMVTAAELIVNCVVPTILCLILLCILSPSNLGFLLTVNVCHQYECNLAIVNTGRSVHSPSLNAERSVHSPSLSTGRLHSLSPVDTGLKPTASTPLSSTLRSSSAQRELEIPKLSTLQ